MVEKERWRLDQESVFKENERLRREAKPPQGSSYVEDPDVRIKLAYLEQNEQMLRGEIDRLVQ